MVRVDRGRKAMLVVSAALVGFVLLGGVLGRTLAVEGTYSFLKLFNSTNQVRRSDISMAISGTPAVAWDADDHASSARGIGFLGRQAGSILSGTSEIQRNIISERVLGLPREPSLDSKVPFREVRHNRMPSGRES